MGETLADLLKAAAGKRMTPEEIRQQKISFVMGMLPHDSETTREEVEALIPRDEITKQMAAEVKPLEWVELVPGDTWAAGDYTVSRDGDHYDLSKGGRFINDGSSDGSLEAAQAAAQADYEQSTLPALTLRPVSEVQAEAHAAAIEAAADKMKHMSKVAAVQRLKSEAVTYGCAEEFVRTLHTDASRDYLAKREERIKREAREEALDIVQTSLELEEAETTITALIEKGNG